MNYSENLFQSIDEILRQRLNEIQFDKTVLCTIVSQDEDDKTKYWVTDGSLRFEAFSNSDSDEYLNKSQVYVLVPEGNYEKRKIILGEYTDNKEDKVYQQATENMQLKAFDDFVSAWDSKYHDMSLLIDQPYMDGGFSSLDFSFHGLGGFTQLGIEFSITSLIANLKHYQGRFGIKFEFYDINETDAAPKNIVFTTFIDSKQIFGNPYTLTEQQRLKFIQPFNSAIDPRQIKFVRMYLYNDTQSWHNEDRQQNKMFQFKNIKLYLGYSSEEVSKMYNTDTQGLVTFLPSGHKLEYPLEKMAEGNGYVPEDIYMNWITQENDKWKIYNLFQPHPSYITAWGQYEILYQGMDSYIDSEDNNKVKSCPTKIEKALGVYYKDITTKETDPENLNIITKLEDQWHKSFNEVFFDSQKTYVSFQSTILEQTSNEEYNVHASNSFYFTNKKKDSSPGVISKSEDLVLELALGDRGIYNIYGNDNQLIDNKVQFNSVTVKFTDSALNSSEAGKFIITWKIPKLGTLLAPKRDSGGEVVAPGLIFSDEDPEYYTYISYNEEENNNLVTYGHISTTLFYGFKQHYSASVGNNQIICEITNHTTNENHIFKGNIEMYFGTTGVSGTNYNFYIVPTPDTKASRGEGTLRPFEKNKEALVYESTLDDFGYGVEEGDNILLTAYLENADGQRITDRNILDNIEWTVGSLKFYNGDEPPKGDTCIISRRYSSTWFYTYVTAKVNVTTNIMESEIQLKAYYLPTYGSSTIQCLSGPFNVIYDQSGLNPNYSHEPYTFNEDLIINGVPLELTKLEIYINGQLYDDLINSNKFILNPITGRREFYPDFPSFLSSTDDNYCYLHAVMSNGPDGQYWGWARPIFIGRNNYTSMILNKWNMVNDINDDENYILSQMVGAGTKDRDNKFTGVIMGEVGKAFSRAKNGLYGFQRGNERFSFTEDGSAFIGNKTSYISFNENNTRSGSNEFVVNTPSLDINTNNNGGITIYNGELTLYTQNKRNVEINDYTPKFWVDSKSQYMYIDARVTNQFSDPKFYLEIGENKNGHPGAFFSYTKENYGVEDAAIVQLFPNYNWDTDEQEYIYHSGTITGRENLQLGAHDESYNITYFITCDALKENDINMYIHQRCVMEDTLVTEDQIQLENNIIYSYTLGALLYGKNPSGNPGIFIYDTDVQNIKAQIYPEYSNKVFNSLNIISTGGIEIKANDYIYIKASGGLRIEQPNGSSYSKAFTGTKNGLTFVHGICVG